MNTIKKVMIVMIILIAVLIIALVIILRSFNKNNSSDYNSNTVFEQQISYEENNNILKETNRNQYYAVKNIVDKYMRDLNNLKKDDIKDNSNAVYSILDKQYVEEFNVTESNVKEKFNIYTDNEKIHINDMYTFEKSASIKIYFIYGTTINTGNEIKLLVKTDSKNSTFSIFPGEYLEKYGYNEQTNVESINILEDEILANEYNTFKYSNVSDEQMAIYYFEDLKNKVFEENGLYNILDENYRQKKFSSIEKYNLYLNNLKNDVINRSIVQYKVSNEDGYNVYILVDQEDNYYIFKENAIMYYTVILHTYTVEIPQLIYTYNNATDAEKVLINIQKVFAAINDQDYNYVYDKLDSTFKQNNFPTLEDFEKYIQDNFFEKNKIGYSQYRTSGNLHIYDITITDRNNSNSSSITKNFIMQLLDGTNFVMSFNV